MDDKRKSQLGITKEYNRNLYINKSKMDSYKIKAFKGKKTIKDPITGKTLHLSSKAAEKKVGLNKKSSNSSDTDHIIPVKSLHDRYKHNPFLSDDNLEVIANSEVNFQILSAKTNRSKKDKSNFKIVVDKNNDFELEGKNTLVRRGVTAEIGTGTLSAKLTVKNVSNEFVDGAKSSIEASVIPLALMGVNNLVKVANGEKKMEEAIKETGETLAVTAVSGGAIRLMTTALNNTLNNSSTKVFQAIGNSNIVTQTITVSLLVKDSLVSYLNGDINSEQFMEQIGEKGVGMISGIQGALIGQALIPVPVVGAFVGSLIASTVCVEVYKFANKIKQSYKSFNEYSDLESRIDVMANSALREMEKQRTQLKEYIGQEFERWDMEFSTAFDQMVISALNDDVNGVASAFDKILSFFGEDVRFKTYEEFDDFFMDETPILKL